MIQVLIHLIQLLKRCFLLFKTELDKVNIDKLLNDPSCLNNLKTKVDDLDVDKSKSITID